MLVAGCYVARQELKFVQGAAIKATEIYKLLRMASRQWWLVLLRSGLGPRSRRWAPDPVGIVGEINVERILTWWRT